VIVAGTVIHALLIEGTMETMSKTALCALVGAVNPDLGLLGLLLLIVVRVAEVKTPYARRVT